MTNIAESSGSGGQEVGKGMGLFLTTIFLAGHEAGGGVLMLPGEHPHIPNVLVTILTPAAMTNTVHIGLVLLLYFTVNGAFVGTRLGLCWLMVEEKFPEL